MNLNIICVKLMTKFPIVFCLNRTIFPFQKAGLKKAGLKKADMTRSHHTGFLNSLFCAHGIRVRLIFNEIAPLVVVMPPIAKEEQNWCSNEN